MVSGGRFGQGRRTTLSTISEPATQQEIIQTKEQLEQQYRQNNSAEAENIIITGIAQQEEQLRQARESKASDRTIQNIEINIEELNKVLSLARTGQYSGVDLKNYALNQATGSQQRRLETIRRPLSDITDAEIIKIIEEQRQQTLTPEARREAVQSFRASKPTIITDRFTGGSTITGSYSLTTPTTTTTKTEVPMTSKPETETGFYNELRKNPTINYILGVQKKVSEKFEPKTKQLQTEKELTPLQQKAFEKQIKAQQEGKTSLGLIDIPSEAIIKSGEYVGKTKSYQSIEKEIKTKLPDTLLAKSFDVQIPKSTVRDIIKTSFFTPFLSTTTQLELISASKKTAVVVRGVQQSQSEDDIITAVNFRTSEGTVGTATARTKFTGQIDDIMLSKTAVKGYAGEKRFKLPTMKEEIKFKTSFLSGEQTASRIKPELKLAEFGIGKEEELIAEVSLRNVGTDISKGKVIRSPKLSIQETKIVLGKGFETKFVKGLEIENFKSIGFGKRIDKDIIGVNKAFFESGDELLGVSKVRILKSKPQVNTIPKAYYSGGSQQLKQPRLLRIQKAIASRSAIRLTTIGARPLTINIINTKIPQARLIALSNIAKINIPKVQVRAGVIKPTSLSQTTLTLPTITTKEILLTKTSLGLKTPQRINQKENQLQKLRLKEVEALAESPRTRFAQREELLQGTKLRLKLETPLITKVRLRPPLPPPLFPKQKPSQFKIPVLPFGFKLGKGKSISRKELMGSADLGISEDFTARILGLKPLKIKASQLKSIEPSYRGLGIRLKPIIIPDISAPRRKRRKR